MLSGKSVTFTGIYWDTIYDAFQLRSIHGEMSWPQSVSHRYWIRKNLKMLRKIASDEELKFINQIKSIARMKSEDYKKLTDLILANAEATFKKTVIDQYPYTITPVQPSDLDGQLALIKFHETWLADNLKPGSFIAYPTAASGKYKEDCRKIFFKNKTDRFLFKMSV